MTNDFKSSVYPYIERIQAHGFVIILKKGSNQFMFFPLISTSLRLLLKLFSSLLRAATILTTSGSVLKKSGTCFWKDATTQLWPRRTSDLQTCFQKSHQHWLS